MRIWLERRTRRRSSAPALRARRLIVPGDGQGSAAGGAQAARLQRRVYELGEKNLFETLLANGQLYQATRAEIQARVEAWRALTKLRLDAHALWADAE